MAIKISTWDLRAFDYMRNAGEGKITGSTTVSECTSYGSRLQYMEEIGSGIADNPVNMTAAADLQLHIAVGESTFRTMASLVRKRNSYFRRSFEALAPVLGVFVAAVLQGCNSYHTLTVDERNTIAEPQNIFRVELKDRSFVDFSTDSSGYGRLEESEIVGIVDDGTTRRIPLNEVERIFTKGPSTAATVGNLSFIGVSAAFIIYAIWGNHPSGW